MFRDLKTVTEVVLHCSATPNGRRTTVLEIDQWHIARGFRRSPIAVERDPRQLTAIGYHRVIYTNGEVVQGRDFDEVGAHAPRPEDMHGLAIEAAMYPGNSRSIGVCLIGTDAYTPLQWGSLRDEVRDLMKRFPIERLWSHNQLTTGKTCPGFSASDWFLGGMDPVEGRVYLSTPV